MGHPEKAFDENIPDELKAEDAWVGAGPDPKTGKPKCPVLLRAKERRASTRKPDTWGTFSAASAFHSKYADGKDWFVGFVLAKEHGLIYVDVDDALDEHQELREWAKPYVEPFIGHAYIEVSPSGRGLHIFARGVLPESVGAGGKANFPQHASAWAKEKGKVPEVAIFSQYKYSTITGRVWRKQHKLGDGAQAVLEVWKAAGIHATRDDAEHGEAPEDLEAIEVDKGKIPTAAKKELKDCTAANAEDRSKERFKLYAQLAEKFEPEQIYAIVRAHGEWYQDSGAAEKGANHTWNDVCRVCAKAQTAKKEFEKVTALNAEENKKAAVNWKDLGISVSAEQTKSGPVYRAIYGAHNMAVVMSKHPDWQGRIRLNLFKERLELDGKPLQEHHLPALAEACRAYLGWEREPQLDLVWKALVAAGNENAYHPVQGYLRGLSWDGVKRIDDWLERVGCEKSKVTRTVGRKWLISLVARALRPGCKMDNILVLEGPQGRKKSTVIETLVGGKEFFTDAHVTFDKDGQMIMHGSWVIELAELATFQKAEQLKTKQFISSPTLTFRAPYGRVTVTRLRHFVLVGTTNDKRYLTDTTGNRRYWPVRTAKEKLDVEWVAEVRGQLLAEAVVAFEAGEPWWFDEEPEDLEAAREERMEPDALGERVAEFIARQEDRLADAEERMFTMSELMQDLGFDVEKKATQMKLAEALEKLGLFQKQETRKGFRGWWWRKRTWLTLVPPATRRTSAVVDSRGEDLSDVIAAPCLTSVAAKVRQEVRQDKDLSDVR